MDPRMYPLATFVRELRQDWSLHVIQTALAEVQHLPFDRVAPAAVRAACDPAVTHPRALEQFARAAMRAASPTGPPRMCQVCRRPHDPENPDAHVSAPSPEVTTRGAALARAALREAVTPRRPEPPPAHYDELPLPIPEHLAAGIAHHDDEEPERERYP